MVAPPCNTITVATTYKVETLRDRRAATVALGAMSAEAIKDARRHEANFRASGWKQSVVWCGL